jgi:histidinol dehydrogenase
MPAGPSELLIVADDVVPALWHLIYYLKQNTVRQSSNFVSKKHSLMKLKMKYQKSFTRKDCRKLLPIQN